MPNHHFKLASHVRARQVDDQVILLDLRRGKYVGVAARPLSLLVPAIAGLSAVVAAADAPTCRPDGSQLLASLHSQGLITIKAATRPAPVALEEALRSMNAEDHARSVRFTGARVSRFLAGSTAAAFSLKFRTLLAITESVTARRDRRVRTSPSELPDSLRDAVAVFEKLRPLLFASRDKCLFDSLALINFLALEGLFPRWVIGVTTHPFAAHSWVQEGSTVLNDQHEHVRRFRPILVV